MFARSMLCCLIAILSLGALADVRPNALFSDHMVLQQEMPLPVWGVAAPDEEVTVTFGAQKKTVKAGADGKWMVKLDALKATSEPAELIIAGKNIITLKNVVVGEVWIGSGQSNMEWNVNGSNNPAEEKAASSFPMIRLFTVKKTPAPEPQYDVPETSLGNPAKWAVCGPETVGPFSAVLYFFGRDLHKSLNVPVGLIHTSWGGTPAEYWTSKRVLEATPELKFFVEKHEEKQKNIAAELEKWKNSMEKHKEAVEAAKKAGKPAPRAPGDPSKSTPPAGLYNGMIAPLIPYAIRGATWYQGESNAGNGKLYQTMFPAMIKGWREDWKQGDFAFGFVQLANYMARRPEPGESKWAELREAQTMTLSLPNTGQAVIIDIGDEKDIHPKNKQDVGKRLGLWALSQVYKKDLVYSGPMYESMKVEGGAVRLKFKHVGGGLVAKGGALKGFAIAGEDKKFVWADAKIDGADVVVSSDKVTVPAAVRYAWADNPEATLYNKEDIPASPFRTDAK